MTPQPCRPRRSWQARRRLWGRLGTVALTAVLLTAFLGPWRREIFAPGELSQPHGQILGSHVGEDRCAACHAAAQGSLAAWFSGGGAGHEGVSQSQLCIECHHANIPPERALLAHNLSLPELRRVAAGGVAESGVARAAITWHDSLPRPAFGNAEVQCSACHREHQGKTADLTWMSNTQCQTCHQDRFASFAEGHPDWGTWPYGRGGQIAFDHARHRSKHFPPAGQVFDCRSCHSVAGDGSVARTGSFESACAACHDQSLRVQASQGLDLVALPTLDAAAVRRAGIAIEPWPEAASAADRVSLPPLTQMLLASDPAVASAAAELTSPAANLWQGPPSPTRLRATVELAAGVRNLLDALTRDLHGELARRLGGRPPVDLAGQLSPQLIADAQRQWFAPGSPPNPADGSQLRPDSSRSRAVEETLMPGAGETLLAPAEPQSLLAPGEPSVDPLLQDPLLYDPLLQDPLLSFTPVAEQADDQAAASFDAAGMLPAGGWYRDDRRMAIHYRAAGHADPVLRAVLEFAQGSSLSAEDRTALLELPAIAACAECHRGAQLADEASWRSLRPAAQRRSFTRFSHAPHMHLPALSDCTHCHQLASASSTALAANPASALLAHPVTSVSSGTAAASHRQTVTDFAPLSRATCVQCHTPQAAGDSCTQCHRYHTDPP